MLTREEIERMEELEKGATEGEWNTSGVFMPCTEERSTSLWGPIDHAAGHQSGELITQHVSIPNGKFIAAARAFVPRAIEKLKRREWVGVAKRLPEKTEWVLCFGDGAIACRAFNAKKGQFEDWQECVVPGLALSQITHWMPLPDPPC